MVKKLKEKIGKPPPVVDELFPMVDKFKSYDDYYNTMFPLLLSEMWEEITKSWREQKQNRPEKRSYNNSHIWLKSTEKLGNEDKPAQSELIQIIFQSKTFINIEINFTLNNSPFVLIGSFKKIKLCQES